MRSEVDEFGLNRFIFGPGPVMRDIERRAETIKRLSYANANGRFLHRKTGNLLDNLTVKGEGSGDTRAFEVGTPATKDDFAYPTYHDERGTGGGRWMTQAILDAGFVPTSRTF